MGLDAAVVIGRNTVFDPPTYAVLETLPAPCGVPVGVAAGRLDGDLAFVCHGEHRLAVALRATSATPPFLGWKVARHVGGGGPIHGPALSGPGDAGNDGGL